MSVSNSEWLRGISEQDLALLGLDVVAYIKPVTSSDKKNGLKFTIHAADGSNIGSSESLASAMFAVHRSDMIPLRVH